MSKYLVTVLIGLCMVFQTSCFGTVRDYSGGTLAPRRALMDRIVESTVYIEVSCTSSLPSEVRALLELPGVLRKGGSGVILRSGVSGSYILTAKHVVADVAFYTCASIEVFRSSDVLHQSPIKASIKYVPPDEPEDKAPQKVGRWEIKDRETDVAVVFVAENMGVNNRLATRSFVGEPVVAAGFPALQPPELIQSVSITEGVLATKLFCKTKGLCVIRTSTQIYRGSSGGPLFNYHGEVVGVASFVSALGLGPVIVVIAGGHYFVPYRVIRAELYIAKSKGLLPVLD